jgi:hypothetical protein
LNVFEVMVLFCVSIRNYVRELSISCICLYAFSLNKVNSSFCGLLYRNLRFHQKNYDYQQFLLPSRLLVEEERLRHCTSCAVFFSISRVTHCLA